MAKKKDAPPETTPEPTPIAGPCERLPGSLRELGRQILAQRDPTEVGRKLLDTATDSVRVRLLEMFADWAFGKAPGGSGGPSPAAPAVRIICDIPRPPYERPPDE